MSWWWLSARRYDDDTQRAMAREVLKGAAGGRAAVISAPSVMNGIKVGVLAFAAFFFCNTRSTCESFFNQVFRNHLLAGSRKEVSYQQEESNLR